ncbi:phosphotransferase family protein [Planobispora longispora]|uniref:Aminoglycoside phosphotransferase n=1 Tax=Planobispora longispora TaxID=28887 RepID=A0A8J3W5D4_9ACTN|nr:aminoglycoside phosphotransferase family protein [Planobispora longispora]GIH76460.1 aminoglycoside phosphotransferase [Planobispora longispora]
MIDAIGALLGDRLPGYEVRSVTRLGEGWDNVAYEVNGELIVRRSKEPDPSLRGESVRREADLLAAVARLSPLPVPEPLFADAEAGVMAYAKLPGVPMSEHRVADPARLAPVLGAFLSSLHLAPVAEMEKVAERDFEPPQAWLSEAGEDYREIAELMSATARRAVEGFLGRTPPAAGPRALVFCHNDLGDEHVLVDPGTDAVTGIIDWTDAAIADPAYDLALIYRDLGPEVLDLTLASYGGRWDGADLERAVFYARCTLLQDIAYGVRTGARHYTESGLAHLDRTFADA